MLDLTLFSTPTCTSCKIVEKALRDQTAVPLALFVVDVLRDPAAAQRYGVMSVPTLLLMRKSRLVRMWRGMPPLSMLMRELAEYSKEPSDPVVVE